MNIIKFSKDWNSKLQKSIFTTIRAYDYKKWNYYKSQEDNEFRVLLNNKDIGKVILINAEYINFNQLSTGLICADTGLRKKEALKVFEKFGIDKNSSVIVLTFERVSDDIHTIC